MDGAIFADTGWEPAAVYEHLDRLEREALKPAGIPLHRVSVGHIRQDALNPEHRFASMPLFIRNPDGGEGMARRQCTNEYKLKPIKRKVRELLGYPGRARLPRGVFAEQWVGISRDEFHRAKDSGIRFLRSHHPLLHLDGAADGREGWTRDDCKSYLASRGFGQTPKSACIGCPFHGNRQWRELRDHSPAEWADAVDFDRAIRRGNARGNARGQELLGQAFLHRSRVPLGVAPIDHVTRPERERDDNEPTGCSPWGCRAGDVEAVT